MECGTTRYIATRIPSGPIHNALCRLDSVAGECVTPRRVTRPPLTHLGRHLALDLERDNAETTIHTDGGPGRDWIEENKRH